MRRALIAIVLLTAACGDDSAVGPFDKLPLDGDFILPEAGLTRPVHVARDQYGVAHINAETIADAAFVQGYVMAHDRLPQMDILRRFGAGTLAELFGTLDPDVIDTDLEMRVHRMKPLAQESWAALQASADPTDQQIVVLLQRFSDGVNAYAQAIRTDDNPTGMWKLHDDILTSFDPTRFAAWSPVDSLVLGRFQAFALSWTAPFEIELTELYQKLRQRFDQSVATDPSAVFARKGITRDFLRIAPVGKVPTIDGFPNVGADSGSRSDGGARAARSVPASAAPEVALPAVPLELFAQARTFFQRGLRTGPNGSFGPHAFMHPFAGSNNWAVGPSRTGQDSALLASDQHLQLPNPSIFYPTHLSIAETGTDVLGVTFPGIPGVILGTNGALAWSATVSEHDVNDVYLEQLAPCGQGTCVTFNGSQVPIQTFTETINIGTLGTISDTRTATYEVVPHHGPIVPVIDKVTHKIVPRTSATAMSIKYTGYKPSFEIRALWNLGRATSVEEGFRALADFSYGSQNWTMIDSATNIGWTTQSTVPVRAPAAYTWNIDTNPNGLAPFFVLPGDGTAEWQGELSSRYIPHVLNPQPPRDYIATANADPVGATFDGDPLNQPMVDGRPLYVGVTYAAGVRQERISQLIEQRGVGITIDDMARIQHDTTSNVGAKLTPAILNALARLDSTTGAPADVIAYLGALSGTDRQRLTTARALLESWSFATSTAGRTGSAATSIFNAWMHFFMSSALADELTAVGLELFDLQDNFTLRIVHALLTDPDSFVQSTQSDQPIVCDDMANAGTDDSCTKVILKSLVAAMTHLETVFPGVPAARWDWGQLHRLKIEPLFPNTALSLPAGNEPGFPKSGDMFAVNRSDTSWSGLDFSQSADGPAQRFLAIAEKDPFGNTQPIRVKWALPGGVIFDPSSRHYRDLLDDYYLKERHFDAPFSVNQINAAGESRWVFRTR
ncbi:MAG: penicillin acylase family protein [Deltaproteobacteria bacterium]|nr:penicillin acylase family protein [Deltaproteobacteria bacterium]